MRDARIALFSATPITVSTSSTTTGLTQDLLSGYVPGTTFEGAPSGYGIGVEVMLSTITGTSFEVEIYWETSDDDSTWVRDALVLKVTELIATLAASNGGTKMIIPSRLTSKRRYARLKVVSTNMSSESFILNAWVSDGTPSLAYGGDNIRY